MGAELFHADGRTDRQKLTVAFRNFANTFKNLDISHFNIYRKTKLSQVTTSLLASNSQFQIFWYCDVVKIFRVINLVNLYTQEQCPRLVWNILCYDGVSKIRLIKTFDTLDWPLPFYAYEGNIRISNIISNTNQNKCWRQLSFLWL